jgi:hypothetical protein
VSRTSGWPNVSGGGTKARIAAFEILADRSVTAIVAGGCTKPAAFTGGIYGEEKLCTKNKTCDCASGQIKCRYRPPDRRKGGNGHSDRCRGSRRRSGHAVVEASARQGAWPKDDQEENRTAAKAHANAQEKALTLIVQK